MATPAVTMSPNTPVAEATAESKNLNAVRNTEIVSVCVDSSGPPPVVR